MLSKIEQGKQNRDAILSKLGAKPLSANEIAEKAGLTYDTAGRHLRALAEEGTIKAATSEDDGRVRVYTKS